MSGIAFAERPRWQDARSGSLTGGLASWSRSTPAAEIDHVGRQAHGALQARGTVSSTKENEWQRWFGM
jgi:hypothetical protein